MGVLATLYSHRTTGAWWCEIVWNGMHDFTLECWDLLNFFSFGGKANNPLIYWLSYLIWSILKLHVNLSPTLKIILSDSWKPLSRDIFAGPLNQFPVSCLLYLLFWDFLSFVFVSSIYYCIVQPLLLHRCPLTEQFVSCLAAFEK